MKKRFLFLVLFFALIKNIRAQEMNYAVSGIAPDLLKNANAVLRMDDTKIKINGPGGITVHHKYAITILNEAGDIHTNFITYYNKFTNVRSMAGELYDANGVRIRTMKNDDLRDYGLVPDFELIDDYRAKVHNFYSKNYPYTIEYESEVESKEPFLLPNWQPVDGEKFAVENSSTSVECPSGYLLRYKAFNYKDAPVIDSNSATKKFTWSVTNLSALIKEEYQPEWYELTPSVFFGLSDFEFDAYNGNMSTWNDFGKFMYTLNAGRDELPDNIKKIVHSLIDTVADVHEKIRILYKYLQTSTRYVAIELGVGGWQTFDANYVANKGYGDCKALSNYMHSLLKEAGIRSDCLLIRGGYSDIDFIQDFPSDQFNHVIACVPLQTDTVWLECTSHTLPAGYLSGFTCNRNALLFDEHGGKLVHTPDYTIKDNQQIRSIKATIDSVGFLHADIETKYSGMKQDQWNGRMNALSKEKMMEYLKQEYADIPSYDILKFNYAMGTDSLLPDIDENIELIADNYATVSGTRFFVNPNILTHNKIRTEDIEHRSCDIVVKEGYQDVDSIELAIPDGYSIESIPAKVELNSKFGSYSSYINVIGDKVSYYRSFEQNSGRFPASDSQAFADFLKKVHKADYSKMVFIKHS